jgi:hypothetical protein
MATLPAWLGRRRRTRRFKCSLFSYLSPFSDCVIVVLFSQPLRGINGKRGALGAAVSAAKQQGGLYLLNHLGLDGRRGDRYGVRQLRHETQLLQGKGGCGSRGFEVTHLLYSKSK